MRTLARVATILGIAVAGSAASATTVVLVAAASGSAAWSLAGGLACAVAATGFGSAVARWRRRRRGHTPTALLAILGPVVLLGGIAVVSAGWLAVVGPGGGPAAVATGCGVAGPAGRDAPRRARHPRREAGRSAAHRDPWRPRRRRHGTRRAGLRRAGNQP